MQRGSHQREVEGPGPANTLQYKQAIETMPSRTPRWSRTLVTGNVDFHGLGCLVRGPKQSLRPSHTLHVLFKVEQRMGVVGVGSQRVGMAEVDLQDARARQRGPLPSLRVSRVVT